VCGIAGIYNPQGRMSITPEVLGRMAGMLRHRGPDGAGLYLEDQVGLAHARLSIIDLEGGAQPIHNEDGTLWIVYNGEVFNYPELREGLLARGHRFSTATDTEVILHLYEERSASCLDALNGQFAFAIWDSRRAELFLARDRLGIIPLHYMEWDGVFLFASEIKALFAVPGVPRRLNPFALDQIFTFWAPLPGRTPFEGVRELPPGHWMKTSTDGTTVQKYWELPFADPAHWLNRSEQDLAAETGELIRDAVRIRLRADVPVGCYLSGGLDSSGITTLVKRDFNHTLKTFGVRFEDKTFDEGDFQARMVSFLGCDHREVVARTGDIGSSFPEVLWHTERPVLRTAPVPLYFLSGLVRDNGFKVVLTGEGADEVFGGYNIFREAKARAFWARRPDSAWRPLLIKRLYPYIFSGKDRISPFVRSFFGQGLDKVDDPFFSHLIRWENTSRLKRFFSPDLKNAIDGYSGYDDLHRLLPNDFSAWDTLSHAQYLETLIFLSNYLLSSQGDRVAMAHGVEIRPPFLDHRIVEFMGKVPSSVKIRGMKEKYLLKKIFEKILPREVVHRPKQPYRAPIRRSLLGGGDSPVETALSEEALVRTGIFDAPLVLRFLKKLDQTEHVGEFEEMALTGIVSTQIVHERFVESFSCESVSEARPNLIVDRRKDTK
jgi:asparagine synthase (glutamine-hydrolysing)